MQAEQIEVGATYTASISRKKVRVRIKCEHPKGGWNAVNLASKRPVHIKSADKLIQRIDESANKTGKALGKKAISQPSSALPIKKMGCLNSAIYVLEQAGEPLTCTQIMERILQQKLWTTTGRTPAATLYSAVIREIQRKGDDSRFALADRGMFTLNR